MQGLIARACLTPWYGVTDETTNLKEIKMKNNNVAKHAHKSNRAVIMRDRKKDYKRKSKHRYSK